jgi:uncharacterized membrane protein YbhN (UPF0104 family)
MFILIFSHYARALRWKILMTPMGFLPTKANVFFAVMIGYFFNLLVPRLGEVMKCTTLARYEKVPPDKLIGTIVAERAFDVVCLLLVIILTVVVQFDVVGQFTLDLFSGLLKGKEGRFSFVRLGLVILAIVMVVVFFRWLFKRYGHSGFIMKLRHFVKGIGEGLTSIRKVKSKGWFLFYTVVIWAMYLLSIYIGFYAFSSIEHLGIKGSLSILTFGSLGMIIPTPGGMGSYQYIVTKALALYGVSEVAAFAFGNVLWGAQTLILIVCGVISLLLIPLFNKNYKPVNTTAGQGSPTVS